MARIDLTPEEIDYIGRVVETELGKPGSNRVSPQEYERMVGAVVDTILNRQASSQFPGTIRDVLDQNRAFSKIAGPARLDPYGSVLNAPRASEQTQRVVNEHIAQRSVGKPSEIGGAVNYANRNQSDKLNRDGWIDPMIAAGAIRFGNEDTGFVHDHGVAPGFFPAPPISVGAPAGFMPPVEPDQTRFGLPNIPTPAPIDRPQPYGPVNWEQDRRGLAVLAPPTGSPYVGLTPEATESLQMLSQAIGPRGTNLTSASRSPEENERALGVPDSEHVKGNAYDISLRGMSDAQKALTVERAMMSGAKSLGTYTTTDPSHVGVLHVDFQDRGRPNVHAMVDGSARNMSRAPDWFTQGLSQVSSPTPTPRDVGLSMPSVPTPGPNFAGGMSPRSAQEMPPLPSPPSAPPSMSKFAGGFGEVIDISAAIDREFTDQRLAESSRARAENILAFAPHLLDPQRIERHAIDPYTQTMNRAAATPGTLNHLTGIRNVLGAPASPPPSVPAMPFASEQGRTGPFAPAFPGGPITMAPPAPPMTMPQAPAVPSVPSPVRPDNANYQGPRGNFAVPSMPSPPMSAPVPTPAPPSQLLVPPMGPPQQMQPPAIPQVAVPQMVPSPTPTPRNGFNDMKRAAPLGIGPALMAPAVTQMGRNARTNMQGGRINMFAGIPQAYRSAFTGLGNMFGAGSAPAPTPFSVGSGVDAIQSVINGGLAPGATAQSRSDPNVSFSVNAHGLVERSDGKFSGVWNG